MLINVPNGPAYFGLEKGDSVMLTHEGRNLGQGRIYNKYKSLVILDVDSDIWRAYNMALSAMLSRHQDNVTQ